MTNGQDHLLIEALSECNVHQRFTLHSFIKLLQKYTELILFTLYSFDGIHMSAIRINNRLNVYLPDIIITDIDEPDVPYGEGVTIVKNITQDVTTYNVFMVQNLFAIVCAAPPIAVPSAVPTPGIIDPIAAPIGAPNLPTIFLTPLPILLNTPLTLLQRPI